MITIHILCSNLQGGSTEAKTRLDPLPHLPTRTCRASQPESQHNKAQARRSYNKVGKPTKTRLLLCRLTNHCVQSSSNMAGKEKQ